MMRRSRIIYILTWVALILLLVSAMLLLTFSWNSRFPDPPSATIMVSCWVMVVAPGIFLFSLAVKKAHRLWVDEEKDDLEAQIMEKEKRVSSKEAVKDQQVLDIPGVARKLLRHTGEDAALENVGKSILRIIRPNPRSDRQPQGGEGGRDRDVATVCG